MAIDESDAMGYEPEAEISKSDKSDLLYRDLEEGEEIEAYDEMLVDGLVWVVINPVDHRGVAGFNWQKGYHLPMRRAV